MHHDKIMTQGTSQTVQFTKAQALGNDFIIGTNLSRFNKDQLVQLASRRLGVGCDQIISIEDVSIENAAFVIHFYNSDGSWAGACGNGSRAVAGYYAQETGKTEFTFAVANKEGGHALIDVVMTGAQECRLSMPSPTFDAESIPLKSKDIQSDNIVLNILPQYEGKALSVGNPHIVYIVENAENIPLEQYGPKIENHDIFPERTNVEFIHITDRENIRMRVWERGVGITQACGTGACAVAITAITKGLTEDTVNIHMDGGVLQISYSPSERSLFMQGGYNLVYHGEISL